jgi:hypothetical protein
MIFVKSLKKTPSVIGTFYSHDHDIKKIVELIQKKYPNAHIEQFEKDGDSRIEVLVKNGFFSRKTKILMYYKQKNNITSIPNEERNPTSFLEDSDCEVTQNLTGMINFISSIPFSNQTLKNLFLSKISFTNSFFSFILEGNSNNEIKGLIQFLASELDAFIFANSNTFINPSELQKFLDQNLKTITDIEGNQEVETILCSVKKATEAEPDLLSAERIQRKEKNEVFIKEKNIKVNKWLPCVEAASEINLRSPEAIARRIVILMVLRMIAYGKKESGEIIEYFKKYKLWKDVSKQERQFLIESTEEERCSFSWEIEKVYVLMWAVKKVDEIIFPSSTCNPDQIKLDNFSFDELDDPSNFIDSITSTRTEDDMNDLYYRLDWACVDSNLSGTQVEGLNHSVVYLRHFAINWLINYSSQDWDNVTCDT